MRKKSCATTMAGVVWLLLVLPAWGETALERVRQSGEIHIGTDATYPPFETKVGEAYEGFDIDLGEAVARKLGVRVVWNNVSFDGIFRR